MKNSFEELRVAEKHRHSFVVVDVFLESFGTEISFDIFVVIQSIAVPKITKRISVEKVTL